MGRVCSLNANIGSLDAIVFELSNGRLVAATAEPFEIKVSDDDGSTWSTPKYANSHPNMYARLNFIDSRGYIFFGTFLSLSLGFIIKSEDNGENWSVVLTGEGSSFWNMIEDASGHLYACEYSAGVDPELTGYYGLNVWKSTDTGDTWTKFYTAPSSIRHLHGIFIDSSDRLYISHGHGETNGVYPLYRDGTIGNRIVNSDRGAADLCFVEADDGCGFFGSDTLPAVISRYQPGEEVYETHLNLLSDFGDSGAYDTEIFDMVKGYDGVLYAITNGNSSSKPPVVLASADNGNTWVVLRYSTDLERPNKLTVGRNPNRRRIYIDSNVGDFGFKYIPDYSRDELEALYTSNLSFNGTITILWNN